MPHTPTPWKVEHNYVYGSDGSSIAVPPAYHPYAYDEGGIAHERCAEDTALIVTAVNAYEANEALIKELMAALTYAKHDLLTLVESEEHLAPSIERIEVVVTKAGAR